MAASSAMGSQTSFAAVPALGAPPTAQGAAATANAPGLQMAAPHAAQAGATVFETGAFQFSGDPSIDAQIRLERALRLNGAV